MADAPYTTVTEILRGFPWIHHNKAKYCSQLQLRFSRSSYILATDWSWVKYDQLGIWSPTAFRHIMISPEQFLFKLPLLSTNSILLSPQQKLVLAGFLQLLKPVRTDTIQPGQPLTEWLTVATQARWSLFCCASSLTRPPLLSILQNSNILPKYWSWWLSHTLRSHEFCKPLCT